MSSMYLFWNPYEYSWKFISILFMLKFQLLRVNTSDILGARLQIRSRDYIGMTSVCCHRLPIINSYSLCEHRHKQNCLS